MRLCISMKKIICLIACLLIAGSAAKADFAEHYNLAQQYLSQYQYSSAITEFKKALRINYLDNSARIGLVNSYLARGTYSANKEKNWESAANDYRAGLFYLKYYPPNQDVQNSMQAISNATENLNQCLETQHFDTLAKSRYNKGKELRLQGLFPEAGYEFAQALVDSNIRKDAFEQLADIMKVLNNDPKSAEYYQKAIAIDGSNAGTRLKYARVLDRLNKNDLAVIEYNYALANGGEDPEIMYALERIYRQKLEQSPNDAPTLTNLGAVLQKQNKYDEALRYYSQAGQLDPANITTRLNVGTLYQQQKSYDSAIAAYDSILTLYPDNKDANIYKAQCLAAQGQNDAALEIFNKILHANPTDKDVKAQIFDSLKASKTPAQIMAYMSQNSAIDQSTINDMYGYAIELHKQQKYDDAINCYREVLKVKTDNAEMYINLAIALKQKGDMTQAKATLQDAKTKFPANKQISDNLNALLQEAIAGKFDDALKFYNNGEFQKALTIYQSIQPPSYDSLTGIAACYKGLNNDNQSIEYYKKAFELSPSSDAAYYIGVICSEKENWPSSKYYLKKALDLNPSNQKAKDLYQSVLEQFNIKELDDAIALYDKGEYSKALSIFNRIITSDPKNAYAYYYRGLINDVNKHYLPATNDYKKALQYNNNNADLSIIYYLLGLDYEALTQFKPALLNYKKYVSITIETNEYKQYAQSRIKALKKYEQQ